jgi:hypothetical protein
MKIPSIENRDGFVREYEIRILSAGHTVVLIEEVYLSDHAAIRSGKKFAADRPFEVWRDLDCIYGGPGSASAPKADQPPPQ